jgi:signal transduction histidine kinase
MIVAELMGGLERLESLLGDLSREQGEQQAIKSIARLARRYLASRCWIYTADGGKLRLAAGPDKVPADLQQRIADLSRKNGKRPRRAGAFPIVPMLYGGELIGAIAFSARAPSGAFQWWTAQLLASQGALALGCARSRAGLRHGVQVRDDAFAAAGHDIGNSLAALSLQVRAMLQAAPRGERSVLMSRLQHLEKDVGRLHHLSRRMFDTARITSGSLVPELAQVDFAAVVRETLQYESEQLAWRGCAVEFNGPRRLTGRWDRAFLQQIVENLLSNAIKYGLGRKISVALSATASHARLRMKDRGIGIDTGDQARIFEKFERATSIEETSSLGLGLWLVREMVGALRGRVRLQSAAGSGSTFEVEIPRRAPARSGGGQPR